MKFLRGGSLKEFTLSASTANTVAEILAASGVLSSGSQCVVFSSEVGFSFLLLRPMAVLISVSIDQSLVSIAERCS